jgi:sigma-B regulation protein RsbU (phosphoserine phosphatase)
VKSDQINFSNAGHSPMLHYRHKEGSFVQVDTKGLPVGVEAKETYIKKVIKANKDDIFILYTDGLPETMGENGSLYTLDRLKKLISDNSKKSADEIVKVVENDIKLFKGSLDLDDDQTLIVIKVVEM